MKRLFEVLISIMAGMLLLFLYVNFGGDKLLSSNYSISALAAAAGGLFIVVGLYLKRYWIKRKK
jgi:hypothetical protein